MTHKNKYGLLILSIMVVSVLIVFYNREKRANANYEIGFYGVILKIEKVARQYDDVYVSDGKRCLLLKDLLRRDEGYEIAVGDSLVKPKNSSCYIYKRKNAIIYQACGVGYGIYFVDGMTPCK